MKEQPQLYLCNYGAVFSSLKLNLKDVLNEKINTDYHGRMKAVRKCIKHQGYGKVAENVSF